MHGATWQEVNQYSNQGPMTQDNTGGTLRFAIHLRLAVHQREQAVERQTPRVDGQVDIPGQGVQETSDRVRTERDYWHEASVEGAILFGLILLSCLIQCQP